MYEYGITSMFEAGFEGIGSPNCFCKIAIAMYEYGITTMFEAGFEGICNLNWFGKIAIAMYAYGKNYFQKMNACTPKVNSSF